jgi:hypothetical protein
VHDAEASETDAKGLGCNLKHFGVKPLTHFGAAVVELNAAVGIDEQQCAGLVVANFIKGNAKFDGGNG